MFKKKSCDECPDQQPELLEGNEDTWFLWTSVQTQWRTSFGGVIGLDYMALDMVATKFDIELNKENFEKIRILEAETLKKKQKNN